MNLPCIINAMRPLLPYPIDVVRNKLLPNDGYFDDFFSYFLDEDTVKYPGYGLLGFSSNIYCQRKCEKISPEHPEFIVNIVIAVVHRDIKFHNGLVKFRKQLQSVGLPTPEVKFFEEMHAPPFVSPSVTLMPSNKKVGSSSESMMENKPTLS